MLTLLLLCAGGAGLAWAWKTRPRQRRTVIAVVAIAGLSFQVLHALEHVVQAGAWVAAPDQPPFLTPWAVAGRDALAVTGSAALGNELLHLGGNFVFMAGLAALWALQGAAPSRALRAAVIAQAAHVLEHVALTATLAVTGRAIGVTTLFGLLDAGPTLWGLRVVAHFTINGIATVAAMAAVVDHGLLSVRPRPPQPT